MKIQNIFYEIKRILCLLLLAVLLTAVVEPVSVAAESTSIGSESSANLAVDNSVNESLNQLISWFDKQDTLNPYEADSSVSDWVTFCMGRLGRADETASYRKALHSYVEEAYRKPELLDATRATEWHRISLTFAANGEMPSIDFLADGTFYRGYTTPLNAQGVNGCIWALITLDAMDCPLPEDAYDTRESMIKTILSYHKDGSGFMLTSPEDAVESCDIDITANAITALAPYYLGERELSSEELSPAITSAVEDGLAFLSGNQLDDGSFLKPDSKESASSESCSQVLIALTALHIDPENDSCFLKNGHSVLDALMQFQNEDGGFAHVAGDESNLIASSQATEALCAYKLYQEQGISLYDLTDTVSAPTLPDGMTHENYRKENSSRTTLFLAAAGGILIVGGVVVITIFVSKKRKN